MQYNLLQEFLFLMREAPNFMEKMSVATSISKQCCIGIFFGDYPKQLSSMFLPFGKRFYLSPEQTATVE
ncbi:hypothetical protein I3760_01G084900 [Carya illinoinensis]|nr:hypothetical protein I3760_01G084900 [Carya illinoinensis]